MPVQVRALQQHLQHSSAAAPTWILKTAQHLGKGLKIVPSSRVLREMAARQQQRQADKEVSRAGPQAAGCRLQACTEAATAVLRVLLQPAAGSASLCHCWHPVYAPNPRSLLAILPGCLWYCGTVVLWYCDTVVLCGTCAQRSGSHPAA
jgi:hypothetical protein